VTAAWLRRGPGPGDAPSHESLLGRLRVYYFVTFGAFGLYLPFFPAWLEGRGFRGAALSALVSLLPLLSLLSPPLVGMLADGLGLRGRMITFAALSTALGLTALALTAFFFDPLPFWPVFSCFVLFAAFRGPLTGLADVLAMESSPNYGRMRLFGSLGFLALALVGGQLVLLDHPYQLPALVAGALWLVVIVSRVLPKTSTLPPRPVLADARMLLRQPGYRWLLVTVALVFMSNSAYDLCASLRVRELGASSGYVGAFWALATGAEIGLLYFAAPFLRRVGPGKLLVASCVVAAGRWYFLSEATSLAVILAAQPLHAVTFALMWASAIAALQREVGHLGLATAQGLYSAALAVGSIAGLWLFGPLYEVAGSARVFQVAAVLALLAGLVGTRLIRWTVPDAPR
jgi:PPP family 3-phenylpropionic acid transporter